MKVCTLIKWILLRRKLKSKRYNLKRIKDLQELKRLYDKRFYLFSHGIIGESLWEKVGYEYMAYTYKVKPMLEKRILYYKKKVNEMRKL